MTESQRTEHVDPVLGMKRPEADRTAFRHAHKHPAMWDENYVASDGPDNKSVQCLMSPRTKKAPKSYSASVDDADASLRHLTATTTVIENYLRLDTELGERIILRILDLVRDTHLSNLQVIKRLRVFFPEEVNLWHGLSVYIMQSIDPTTGKERRRKRTMSGTSELDRISSRYTASQASSLGGYVDLEDQDLPDQSLNSSSLHESPPDEGQLNTNRSKSADPPVKKVSPRTSSASEDGGNAAAPARTTLTIAAAPSSASSRSRFSDRGSRSSRASSSDDSLSDDEDDPRIKIPVAKFSTQLSSTTIISPRTVASCSSHEEDLARESQLALVSLVAEKVRNPWEGKASFATVAARIRRGVAFIRTMVRQANDMRKKFMPDSSDESDDSSDENAYDDLKSFFTSVQSHGFEIDPTIIKTEDWSMPGSRQKSGPGTQSASYQSYATPMNASGSYGSSFESLYDGAPFQNDTPKDERRASFIASPSGGYPISGPECTLQSTPSGRTEVYDQDGREIINLEAMARKGRKIFDEQGREVINIHDVTKPRSKIFDDTGNEVVNLSEITMTSDRQFHDHRGREVVNMPEAIKSETEIPDPKEIKSPVASVPQLTKAESEGFDNKGDTAAVIKSDSKGLDNKEETALIVPEVIKSDSSKILIIDGKEVVNIAQKLLTGRKLFDEQGFEVAVLSPSTSIRKFYDSKGREIVNLPGLPKTMGAMFDEMGKEVVNIFGISPDDQQFFNEDGRLVISVHQAEREGLRIFDEKGKEVVDMAMMFRRWRRQSKFQRKKQAREQASMSPLQSDERIPVTLLDQKISHHTLIRAELLNKKLREPGSLLDISTSETFAAEQSLAPENTSRRPRPHPSEPFADMPQTSPRVAPDPAMLVKTYMEKHGIYQLFETFLKNLVLEQPNQPIDYLINLVHEIGIYNRKNAPVIHIKHKSVSSTTVIDP